MKTFKQFLQEFTTLSEASINEGDIIEGIFAIACGLYVANGEVTKQEISKVRSKVNFEAATKSQQKVPIVSKKVVGKDTVSVDLAIRLKSVSSTFGAYGDTFDPTKDVGKIDKKIDLLIKSVESSKYIQKLRNTMEEHLSNNVKENLHVTITADGVDGESSGGNLKGDVFIAFDIIDDKGKSIKDKPTVVAFSLKSNSKTVSNRSPIDGMVEVAKEFGVKYANEKHYIDTGSKVAGNAAEVFDTLKKMFAELGTELEKKSDITKIAIKYLHRNLHGSDQAFLVDIGSKIKEIDPKELTELGSKIKLVAKIVGQNIRFVDAANPAKYLFQLRLKLRTSSSGATERKFYVELGNILGSK